MDDFDRENPIFESVVPFRIQQTDRETKQQEYMVRILSGTKGSTSAQRQRALCIEITDDNEPVFYHSLCVSENEFTDLKTDQSILVDFLAFPTLFIELLEQVIASKHEPSPRYTALIVIRDPAPGALSTLSIIETNRFKQLNHLQLSFRIGNDTIVKRYLTCRLLQTKSIVQKCRKSIDILEQEIQTAKVNQDNATTEIQRLRTDIETQEANLRAKYTNDISLLKDTLQKEKSVMEDQYRQSIEHNRLKHEQHVNDLTTQLTDAHNTVNMVRNEMSTLQRNLREQTSRITSLTDDLSSAQEEIGRLRTTLHAADEARTLSAKEAASQLTRIAVLEQQLYDQKNILEQTQALLEASKNEATKAEESKTFFKSMYDRANEKLELSANEIKKGNTVITQLQEEYRTVKAKQKMKSEVLRSTEERLSEREHTITNLQRELDTTKVQLDREQHQREQSEQSLETVKGQLSAAREAIQEQQGVIAWLNKTLTEATTNGAIPANPRTYLAATAASAAAMAVTNGNATRKPNGTVSTSFLTTVPQTGNSGSTVTNTTTSIPPRPLSSSGTPLNSSSSSTSVYARTPSMTATNSFSSPDILAATNRSTLPSSSTTLGTNTSSSNPSIATLIGTTAAVVANAANLTRTPIGSTIPSSSSVPPNSTNPYLAGTVPLSDALNSITTKAYTNSVTNKLSSSANTNSSAYFSNTTNMNTSNGSIPGGGPVKGFASTRNATPVPNGTAVTNTL